MRTALGPPQWEPCEPCVVSLWSGGQGWGLAHRGGMQASAPRPGDYNTPLPRRGETRIRGGQARNSDQDMVLSPTVLCDLALPPWRSESLLPLL